MRKNVRLKSFSFKRRDIYCSRCALSYVLVCLASAVADQHVDDVKRIPFWRCVSSFTGFWCFFFIMLEKSNMQTNVSLNNSRANLFDWKRNYSHVILCWYTFGLLFGLVVTHRVSLISHRRRLNFAYAQTFQVVCLLFMPTLVPRIQYTNYSYTKYIASWFFWAFHPNGEKEHEKNRITFARKWRVSAKKWDRMRELTMRNDVEVDVHALTDERM